MTDFNAESEISQSIRENRTLALYPSSEAEAREILESLGAHASDDCETWVHQSGAGYSGSEAVGYYDVWGDVDGDEWRIHVYSSELA